MSEMEYWSWPPRYDDSYRPEAGSRYWVPRRETMPAGDMVFVAAIFSLYLGSWGALAGCERLGCKAFPFGAGAPGMSLRAVQWMNTMKPQAFYGTPSFALYLAEIAGKEGVDPKRFGIKRLFFSGEPGASVPGVKDRIEQAYGGKVHRPGA